MLKNKTVRDIFFVIFCLFSAVSSAYAESCSSSGATETKYTASGCSYTTQTRTCCSNGSWSEWDGECQQTCNPSTKPVETQSCGLDGSGTQIRTVNCNAESLTWQTGSWGTCSYCTPGVRVYNLSYCDNPLHFATCNYSGTGWDCGCPFETEKRECLMSDLEGGGSKQVRWWSEKGCQCLCFSAGTQIVFNNDSYYGVEGWRNNRQVTPQSCL